MTGGIAPIECGNYLLNVTAHNGPPTLIPSPLLEAANCIDVESTQLGAETTRPAVHLHAFYTALVPGILDSLSESLSSADLFITTDTIGKREEIAKFLREHHWGGAMEAKIILVPNLGRNIAPLFRLLVKELKGYGCLLHIHTKLSIESGLGSCWLDSLISSLLPTKKGGDAIVGTFHRNKELGLLIAQTPEALRPYQNWGENYEMAKLISSQVWPERILSHEAVLAFPVGMMFWCRPSGLEELASYCHRAKLWPVEPITWDGSSLHAIERLICHTIEASGLSWKFVKDPAQKRAEHDPGCRLTAAKTDSTDLQHLSVWRGASESYLYGCSMLGLQFRANLDKLQVVEQRALNLEQQLLSLEQQLLNTAGQHTEDFVRLEQVCRDIQATALLQASIQEQTIQDWQNRLQAIQSSLSWRLTGPLRRVLDYLRVRA